MPIAAGSKGIVSSSSKEVSIELVIARNILAGTMTPPMISSELARQNLRELSIETNSACPLSCTYCYWEFRETTKPSKLEDLERFLHEAVNSKVSLLAFVGKEPLADRRALKLISTLNQHSDRKQFRIGLVSNGLFVPRYLDEINELNMDYIDISVDAMSFPNDSLRGSGSSDAAQRALKLLLKNHRNHLFASSVITKLSVPHITSFYNNLIDNGVRFLHSCPVLNFTSNSAIDDLTLSTEDIAGTITNILAEIAGRNREGQVILELPINYTWQLIAQNVINLNDAVQDKNGTVFVKPYSDLALFWKLTLLPPDYWRMARITHDGWYLGAVSSAALANYQQQAIGSYATTSFKELFQSSRLLNSWFEKRVTSFVEEIYRIIEREELLTLPC